MSSYEVYFQVTANSITKERIEDELKFSQIPNIANLLIKRITEADRIFAIYVNKHKGSTIHKMDCPYVTNRNIHLGTGSEWYLKLTRNVALYLASTLVPGHSKQCKKCDSLGFNKYRQHIVCSPDLAD